GRPPSVPERGCTRSGTSRSGEPTGESFYAIGAMITFTGTFSGTSVGRLIITRYPTGSTHAPTKTARSRRWGAPPRRRPARLHTKFPPGAPGPASAGGARGAPFHRRTGPTVSSSRRDPARAGGRRGEATAGAREAVRPPHRRPSSRAPGRQ